MKKKKSILVIIAILFGFILAEALYGEYKRNLEDSDYNAYLIQIGSFKDDLEVNNDGYLVLQDGDIYNVYAGITTKLTNASKIKELYRQNDIEAIIVPTIIESDEFISNLEQFDILLSEVEGKENILNINDVIISRYEELILNK